MQVAFFGGVSLPFVNVPHFNDSTPRLPDRFRVICRFCRRGQVPLEEAGRCVIVDSSLHKITISLASLYGDFSSYCSFLVIFHVTSEFNG